VNRATRVGGVTVGGLAKRFGLAGAAFTALAGTTAAGLWHQLFRRPLPRTKGRLRLEGLEGPVEIGRDRWGVPHIHAQTRHDLWFSEGFCHGQDRLWQLDLYRRIGSGRLAEIAGRPGLGTDRFMRTLGLRRAAEREAGSSSRSCDRSWAPSAPE
jgi:penicillin G amidase